MWGECVDFRTGKVFGVIARSQETSAKQRLALYVTRHLFLRETAHAPMSLVPLCCKLSPVEFQGMGKSIQVDVTGMLHE